MSDTVDTPSFASSPRMGGLEPIVDDEPIHIEPVASVWHLFGLRENPFFQTELKAVADAAYPPGLFVGRQDELRLLARQIGGTPSSRAIIQGAAGVGKTSFVNRLKADLARHGVVSHEKPVRITADMSGRALIAEVLKALLRIRHETRAADASGGRNVLRRARDLTTGDKFWIRVARLVEGEDLLNAGVSIAAVGGSFERARIPAEIANLSLYDELEEAVTLLIREASDCAGASRQVLIHANNLESLSLPDAQKAAALLLNIRDYLMVAGAHWVFVGSPDVESAVFGAFDQVSGIFPSAITLDPLTGDEVGEILERRYQHLKRGPWLVPPVEADHAVALYGRYHGDLRHFLQLLSEAANIELGVRSAEPLPANVIVALMAPRYAARIRSQIGATDYGHLVTVFKGCDSTHELRVADIVRRVRLNQTSAIQLVSRLVRRGILLPVRPEARPAVYRVTGNAGIALGLAA